MAQLRDARTSELIAEGTPTELALLADRLGRDEVLFDDVGHTFDPDAVLEAHRENIAGLEAAAAAAPAGSDQRAELEDALAERQIDDGAVAALEVEATAALEAARELVD